MENILSITELSVQFDQNRVLDNISVNLVNGEILGLLGASGCGKTTLLNAIAGFVQTQSGSISVHNNIIVSKTKNVAPERREVGMIFQDYALFPHLTLVDNIGFGIKKLAKNVKQERVNKLINLLQLNGLELQYPHQLSGGQQQRVAIARALAPQPKLLLLDEPFSNIDARLRADLMQELRALLKRLKMSAIFVTHNKDEIFAFADKVALMNKGKILQLTTPQLICQQPANFHVADFLQLGSFLPVLAVTEHGIKTSLTVLPLPANMPTHQSLVVLIKPNYLQIKTSKKNSNAKVEHITVTEQGYKVHLSLLDTQSVQNNYPIVVFTPQYFSAGELVTLTITPHEPTVLALDH